MAELSVLVSPVGTKILSQKRIQTALSDAVKGKFDCLAFYNRADLFDMSSGHVRKGIKPEVKYTKQFSNLKISVWKDDLTRHKADAIVNAANEDLSHIGGLALALSEAGGPAIQKESSEWVKKNGKLTTGSAVCTGAGNLPCKTIIHAVGPRVSQYASQYEISKAADLLEKAIFKILYLTDEKKMESVAIPAVSSGIFNFPRNLCAKVIVNSVMKFSKQRKQGSRTLEVQLVNNDDPTVKEMEKACTNILGTSDSINSDLQNQSQTTSQYDVFSQELGNVTLHLKTGAIEEENTNVIVNSTGHELDLSKGMVSIALQKKAGSMIQTELKKNGKGGLGDISKTKPYKLGCKAVYHTVCASKNQDPKSMILFSVVYNCLQKAVDEKFSSISFPALGTGNLGFQIHEVSSVMIDAVKQFARSHQKTKLDVYFVIFHSDSKTLEAFQKDMVFTLKQLPFAKSSESTSIKGFQENVEHSKASPCITLYGETAEAMSEAETWIKNILNSSTTMTINNDNVMHFGQNDHDKLSDLQSDFNVDITEVFSNGNWSIIIKGDPVGVGSAALQVENMLCQVQEEIASSEKKELIPWNILGSKEESMYERKSIEPGSKEWMKTEKAFQTQNLYIQKIEKINNFALKRIFELNQMRVGSPLRLYQRVEAQFCKLICTVGFQNEYAPPQDQKSGLGIYFTNNIKKAITLWPDNEEKYLYFFEAEVLTGKSVQGSSGLTVPPEIGNDPLNRYDSVIDGSDIFVIFNGQLALPLYLITCKKTHTSVWK